ncbi:PEP-CTERM sorting domain-containing protein [Massilia sp. RP-1-19]|uniref:PEP-CTERM sorting domain-containing protein n=1 Tax=Massilia polaris TaxID=2728846 RepID=A0A848HKT0_9BURK|nr:choice-of-anchor J domain-containing protein [Massilia polaris]NML61762.1 PEP-CTERM sorting domain-containing protein [Massilia polaris]
MKTYKNIAAAATLALAAILPAAALAQAVDVLSEGFDDIEVLPGWSLINNSVLPGEPWFQGSAEVFPAHLGAPTAYIAANFFSAAVGEGAINNWLITPTLDLIGPTTLTFFTRSAPVAGYNDTLEVRFSEGSGSDPASFDTLLATIGGATPYPGAWQEFNLALPHVGEGRFAFLYTGDAEVSNYVGIDTVSVLSVPEPSAYLMLGAGLFAFTMLRRRQA